MQKENESVDAFIVKLRVLSLSGDFGESVEDNILGQVIEKCYDGYLREKFLQQGDALMLEKPQTLGRAIEHAKKDTLLLGGEKTSRLQEKSDVNQIKKMSTNPTQKQRTVFVVEGMIIWRMTRNAVLKMLSAGNAIALEIMQNVADHLVLRKGRAVLKAVEQTSQDTDEYNPEYVYFARNEGGINFTLDVEMNGKHLIRERFPIRRIQDLLRQLSGAKVFSTLDLRKAYW